MRAMCAHHHEGMALCTFLRDHLGQIALDQDHSRAILPVRVGHLFIHSTGDDLPCLSITLATTQHMQ